MAKNEVLYNLDVLLLSTLTYLDEMSRAPRRPSIIALTPGYRIQNWQHASAAAVVRDVDQPDLRPVELARVVDEADREPVLLALGCCSRGSEPPSNRPRVSTLKYAPAITIA